MAPSDNIKIVFGVVAATGVVLISYVFFRIFGTKSDERPRSRKKDKSGPTQSSIEANISLKSTLPDAQSIQAQKLSPEKESEASILKDHLSHETPDQTSFIVIDQAARESLTGEEGPPSSKKSDRSSDESSFDVVEAGGEEEEEERKNAHAGLEGGLAGDNESSLVILDSDPSGMEASSSSFYQSADETLSKGRGDLKREDAKPGDVTLGSEAGKDHEEESEPSESASDSEQTVMYSLDGKSISQAGASEVSGISKATGDVPSSFKDTKSVADEGKPDKDPDTQSSHTALITEAGESFSEKLAEPTKSDPAPTPASRLESRKVLTSAETARTLTVCQNSASTVSKEDIFNLVELLKLKNPSLQSSVLDCIVRVSVFSHNNNHLHAADCGWVLAHQVQESCQAYVHGDAKAQARLEELSGALTNLSMSTLFQEQLRESVSPLIDVFLQSSVPESLQMGTLRPLTNFCSETTFHPLYKPAIPQLYDFLDRGSDAVRLQCLKILVNLSLNHELVPYLLCAKAPSKLLDLLSPSTDVDLILRTVTLLGNVYSTIAKKQLSQSDLPTNEKVESPHTMFTAMCGVAEVPELRNKVYRLTRHENRDVSQQASKLYHFITEVNK